MEAKELRLGNVVRVGDLEGKVSMLGFDEDILGTHVYLVGDCNGQYEERFIDPIPLTEEWLLRFGFDKKEYRSIFDNRDEYIFERMIITEVSERQTGFYLHKYNEVETCFRDENGIYTYLPIKYVHQLQNLYFALTGTELELKSFVEEK